MGNFVSVFDMLSRQKASEAEKKAAAALEESGSQTQGGKGKGKNSENRGYTSVETLMQQQGSFRRRNTGDSRAYGSIQRNNDGTYQSSAITAIGGGFRRRADIAELERISAHHRASLDVLPVSQ